MSSSIAGVDQIHAIILRRRNEKRAKFEARKRKEAEEQGEICKTIIVLEAPSSSPTSSDDEEQFTAQCLPKKSERCRVDRTLMVIWDLEQLCSTGKHIVYCSCQEPRP